MLPLFGIIFERNTWYEIINYFIFKGDSVGQYRRYGLPTLLGREFLSISFNRTHSFSNRGGHAPQCGRFVPIAYLVSLETQL